MSEEHVTRKQIEVYALMGRLKLQQMGLRKPDKSWQTTHLMNAQEAQAH